MPDSIELYDQASVKCVFTVYCAEEPPPYNAQALAQGNQLQPLICVCLKRASEKASTYESQWKGKAVLNLIACLHVVNTASLLRIFQ